MAKYSDDLGPLAAALANDGRRSIVDRLRAGPATTSELAALLAVGLPAVTKQLGVLSGAGLVQSSKQGRVVTHRLDPAPLAEYATWLASRRSFWSNQLDALTAHLRAQA